MSISSSYDEAYLFAEAYDKKLKATDFDPSIYVFILHEEGSQFFYRSAFLKKWKDYIFVFTEHHKFYIYHKTDLISYLQLNSIPVEYAVDKKIKICVFFVKKSFLLTS